MSTELNVDAKLLVNAGTPLNLGAGVTSNRLQLTLTNLGREVSERQTWLALMVEIGTQETALFGSENDAETCVLVVPNGWSCIRATTAGSCCFRFRPLRGFENEASVVFEISKIVSQTAEGEAQLSFESAVNDRKSTPRTTQSFRVTKRAEKPAILAFSADREWTVPNRSVVLSWSVSNLTDCKVYQNQKEIGDRLPNSDTQVRVNVATTSSYTLAGRTSTSERLERSLVVLVRSAGWHTTTSFLDGDVLAKTKEGLAWAADLTPEGTAIPTQLYNAGDSSLYGVFRHVSRGRERAFLLKTRYPLEQWDLINTSVRGQELASRIPEGLSTSPGAFFDGRLWLIGGSQVSDRVSKEVWSLQDGMGDAQQCWERHEEVPWQARMGHSVLVHDDQLWVMGGCDANRNPLNDVWILENGRWRRGDPVPWSPRCLFSCLSLNDTLYLYGGASQVNTGEGVYRDGYSYKNGKWTKEDLFSQVAERKIEGKAVGACLFGFGKCLHLFCRYEDETGVSQNRIFRWNPGWEEFDAHHLEGWGDNTTYSAQIVEFRGEMLVGRATGDNTILKGIKVYVPEA